MRLEGRPKGMLAAASCHTRAELERAMQLELDFAVLGPVLEKSGGTPLGWEGFAAVARGSTLPLYAIGGLTAAHLEGAWRAGADRLAVVRAGSRLRPCASGGRPGVLAADAMGLRGPRA